MNNHDALIFFCFGIIEMTPDNEDNKTHIARGAQK